jgi:predicted DNA-binding transcriptional regulator AlpA
MDLYTSEQLAKLLNKSHRTIQRHARNGNLPQPLELKARTVWQLSTIRDWLLINAPHADLSALNTN